MSAASKRSSAAEMTFGAMTLTQDNEGGTLWAGDPDEELGHGEEEAADGGHHDGAHEDEGDVLRPEDHVDFQAEPVDRDLHALNGREKSELENKREFDNKIQQEE